MILTRLLLLGILSSLCSAAAFSQSQPNKVSDLVVFLGAASVSPSDALESNQALQSPKPLVASHLQEASGSDSVARASEGNKRSSETRSLESLLDAGADRTCLFIRDYRVVRDSPHSDSTHRDGYTTCVPAARFQISITTERVR
jgi:hypothetical protein